MDSLIKIKQFLQQFELDLNKFTFQTFDDSSNKDPNLAKIFHGHIDKYYEQLISLNEQGAGVFFTVNETDGAGRKESNIVGIRAFFADKDDGDFSNFPIDPTVLVKTRAGQHAYFVLDSTLNPEPELFRNVQKSIANKLSSDNSISDLPRVMRLPGTYNRKSGDFVEVNVLQYTPSLYSLDDIKSAFPYQESKPVPVIQKAYEEKGELLYEVQKFLKAPWSDSKGNNSIFVHSVSNIKRNNYTLSECLKLIESKGEKLDQNTQKQIASIYANNQRYPVDPVKSSHKTSWFDFLNEANLYVNLEDGDQVVVLHSKLMSLEFLDIKAVRTILGGKTFLQKARYAKFEYNPHRYEYEYYDEKGLLIFNSYKPPFWLTHKYFRSEEIGCSELPLQYDKFFKHLFNNDKESIEYILDWMAFSIQGNKNIPILTLVGSARGIGKNIFVYINKALHGDDNFEVCKQQILTKEFNKQLINKTLLHFDEVSISKDREFETIKAYTNPVIAVEGKGVDAGTKKFYGNIILTNNIEESLQGVSDKDDRQFSIPILTSNKLIVNPDFNSDESNIKQLWENKLLIKALAQYLYHRKVDYIRVNTNLKSTHYAEIIKASKTEWHRFLLEEVYPKYSGKVVSLMGLRDAIKRYEQIRLGRVKLEKFCDEYKVMAIRTIGKERCAIFKDETETYDTFLNKLENLKLKKWAGISRIAYIELE